MSQQDPILSIIIPAYNVRPFIHAAVESALAQTYRRIEVIVVDDGSTDNTVEAIANIQDPRLRIIRQENGGLPAARNIAIRAARGEYVGLLDGDDIWFPQKAERHLAAMTADPTIGMTFSYSKYLYEDGTPTGRVLSTRCLRPTLTDVILRSPVGNGSSAIIRMACIAEAGPFDERIRVGAEDYEMCVRILARTGWHIVGIPEPLTGYRIRQTSLQHQYDAAATSCMLALEAVRTYTPAVPERVFALAAANMYRILARKAISAGHRRRAWRLFKTALGFTPRLLLADYRAIGTLFLIVISRFYTFKALKETHNNRQSL